MNEKRKMNSSLKENTPSTWLKRQFLNVLHFVPSNIQELKWQEFIGNQLTDHWIVGIREEIVSTAVSTMKQKYRLKQKLFEFNSKCVHIAWLQLFNWVMPRLDASWRCDTSGKIMYLIVDIEPQSSLNDSWMFGNVLQVCAQKSPSLRTFASPLPLTITAIKPTLNDRSEKTKGQQQRTKSKYIRIGKLNKKYKRTTIMSPSLALRASTESHQMKEANQYLEKYPSHTADLSTAFKNQLSNLKRKDKIDFLAKVTKRTISNSNSKDVIDIRQSIKYLKCNERKALLLGKESTLQLQGSSDRVEILYTISPERSEHLDLNTSNVKQTK